MSTVPIKVIPKDQIIFREGAKGDAGYLIKSGKVEISKLIDGKKLVLENLGPGSLFGEMALILDQDRAASAVASEPVELFVLDKDGFTNMLDKSPKILAVLLKSLVNRLKKTVEQISAKTSDNPFMSVGVVMDMLIKMQLATMPKDRGGPGGKEGTPKVTLPFRDVLAKLREALSMTGADVENVLKKLAGMRQLTLEAPSKTSDRMITIENPDKFLENVKGIVKEMDSSVTQGFKQEQELIDLTTFSTAVGINPENVYKKIASKDVPESIFFFRRSEALRWAQEKGKDFFEKTTKRLKKIEELEGINDVIYVDNETLRQVLGSTDIIKLCKVIKHAEDDAKKKLFANLSERTATMVKQQMEGVEADDEVELADIEENIIGQIKAMKKAAAAGAPPAAG